MQSVKWYHFQWPWVTSDLDFKVTTFFEVVYQKKMVRLKGKVTVAQEETTLWNGTMFGDLDWPLNASRGFVSISWPSFSVYFRCCCRTRFNKFLLYLGYTRQASREAKVGLFCKTVSEFALEYRTTREKLLQQREKKATQKERRRTRGKMIVEVWLLTAMAGYVTQTHTYTLCLKK